MSELELNKDYTYKQICEALGWKYYTGGTAKQAQIREIEDAFEFKHPINKKTQREKKSYIFTKQLRELKKPKRGGIYNTKAIKPMMDYLMQTDIRTGEFRSYLEWFCMELNIFNAPVYNIRLYDDVEVSIFCSDQKISNSRLFSDYVRRAKSITTAIFKRTLATMKKRELANYSEGYMFTYTDKKFPSSSVKSSILNDIIYEVETDICNEMKKKYSLSTNLSGRQLLWTINGKQSLKNEFDKEKIRTLTENHLEQLNIAGIPIDENHSLLNYYPEAIIFNIEKMYEAGDIDEYAVKLANMIRTKTREALSKIKWTDKGGNVWYNYDMSTDGDDMKKIEELLFVHFDPDFTPNVVDGWMKEFIFNDSDDVFNVDDI